MGTYITSKEDLQELIAETVSEQISEAIPSAIRKATRKEWLNTKEVTKLTGWSKRTMQNLRDRNRIPFYQEGHRILYKHSDVLDYLESIHVEARDVTS
ncbi:MAG: helix-turn-helix domain-containing protein [Balneola sp.]